LDTAGFGRGATGPPAQVLQTGQPHGSVWIPAECDVSIRPGWFYHPEEDSLVKTPDQLWNIYLQSVGRGANLILNVPPDRQGLGLASGPAGRHGGCGGGRCGFDFRHPGTRRLGRD
jgi:alpha-L-fucosidase